MDKQWHEERRKGIGGSDVHHVLSLPPYGCAAKLWYEKRGIDPDYPMPYNPNMQRGTDLEEFITSKYEKTKNEEGVELKVLRSLSFVSEAFPHIRCNTDGIIVPENTEKGVLECKAPARFAFQTIKREGLSEGFILQMQHGLYTTGHSWGAFAIQCFDPYDYLEIEIRRNETLIENMLEACHRFWRLVENGPMPAKLDPSDKRCLTCNRKYTCQDLQNIPMSAIDAGDTQYEDARNEPLTENAMIRYQEARLILKEAEELKKEREERLKGLMGARHGVSTNSGKALFKPVASKRWDTKRLNAEMKDDFKDKYQRQSHSMRFNFYPKGD